MKSTLSATAPATAQADATDESPVLFTKKLCSVLTPVKLKRHPSAVDPSAKLQLRFRLVLIYLTLGFWTSVVTGSEISKGNKVVINAHSQAEFVLTMNFNMGKLN